MQAEHLPQDQPPVHRPKSRLLSGKIIIPAAAIVIAAGIAVYRHGGLSEALRLPPVRDASTPASQQGYALVDIVRKDWGGGFTRNIPDTNTAGYPDTEGVTLNPNDFEGVAGLWIRPPGFTAPTPLTSDPNHVFSMWDQQFLKYSGLHVTCKTPNGRVFEVQWEYFDQLRHPLLFVPIPGGYPGSLKYLDVTVTDSKMRAARWRIERLPASEHVLAGQQKIVDHVGSGGVTIAAEALLYKSAFPFYDRIAVQFKPQFTRPDKHWDIAVDPIQPEWDAFDRPKPNGRITFGLVGTDAESSFPAGSQLQIDNVITPFADDDRFVRVSGSLRQFDAYRETVTFRNVPVEEVRLGPGDLPAGERTYGVVLNAPMTQTTPSGITVRLPRQNEATSASVKMADGIAVITQISPDQLLISAGGQAISLPDSPLQRAYGRPLTLATGFAGPHSIASFSTVDQDLDGFRQQHVCVSANTRFYDPRTHKYATRPMGKTVDLTVTLDQRVDLQETPFTFTLPVRDAPAGIRTIRPQTLVKQ